ncbi:MAG TPA: hypothetical protein VEO19_14975 [Terriglobia bacterium]|nr:hypothetical protein [Terriglobia bacterium]
MKLYRIMIASGDYKGRYVGMQFGGGLVTNPDVQKNPPVNVGGYGLWAQERGATQFFEGKTGEVQEALKKMGYDTEVVEIG